MTEKLTDKVSFDFIRYANCWEDADVLLEGLNAAPGSKILSIGSAGDNSFSLLTTDPELVVAIDVNPIQLYLIALKKVCFQQLSHAEILAFLGFTPSAERKQTFHRLKIFLNAEASTYWENHLEQIESGIIHEGKFERYFQLFTKKILPWIHSKKTIQRLLAVKTAEEQRQFYDRKWNNWRWKLLFKIFFSKYVMGKYGRDPEFMKEVEISVGKNIFKKAETHLQSVFAQQNFILNYNLTGSFCGVLPHYLRPENFEKIKENIDRIVVREGFAEDAVKEFGTFHAMNLSNIFEYMDQGLFLNTSEKLIASTVPGGRLAYWNLMVPRSMAAAFPERAVYQEALSLQLSKKDKGFFYNSFNINQVK